MTYLDSKELDKSRDKHKKNVRCKEKKAILSARSRVRKYLIIDESVLYCI